MSGPSWRARAKCAEPGRDPEDWYADLNHPAGVARANAARRICVECPVRAACLEWVMREEAGYAAGGRFGIAGALTPRERHRLARGLPVQVSALRMPRRRRRRAEPGSEAA